MDFNFTRTDGNIPKFPGFFKRINVDYQLIVLSCDKNGGIVVESDEYEIGYYRNDWNFEDVNGWTRISGKIEL